MVEHARLPFSKADIWLACAASPRESEGKTLEPTEGSIFGDVAHKHLEDGLKSGIRPEGSPEAECAAVAYDYAQERWAETGHTATLLAEAPVSISSSGRSDLGGTADIILCNPNPGGELEIIDLKTGAGTYVDEKASPQLRLYALAAIDTFKLTPETIRLTVVQPRYYGDVEAVRSHEMPTQLLWEWFTHNVMFAAHLTDNPDAIHQAGEHCKKCAGKLGCSGRSEAVGEALSGDVLPALDVVEEAIHDNKDVLVYDNVKLADFLHLVPVIKDFCTNIEEHAIEVLMRGETVPGFKVIKTQGVPTWVGDMDDLMAKLKKSSIKESDYMASKLKTPKQVAALKSGTGKPMSKAIAKVIADHTGRTDGRLNLVLESDPRESAALGFTKPQAEEVTTPAAEPQQESSEVNELPDFLV